MPWIAAIIAAGEKIGQGITDYTTNKQNAAYAEADAKQAKLTAAAEASRQRRINRAQEGEMLAAIGAQGTTMEGSPMLAYLEMVKQGELKAQDIRYKGRLQSRAFNLQANMFNKAAMNAAIGAAIGFGGKAGQAYNSFQTTTPTSSGGGDWSGATSGGGFDAWDSGGF